MINKPGNTVGSRNASWLPGLGVSAGKAPTLWRDQSRSSSPLPALQFPHEETQARQLEMLEAVPQQAPEEDKKCRLLQGTEQTQPYSDIIGV